MSRIAETIALLGSLLGDNCSHPGKLLHEHLRNAAELAEKLADKHNLALDNDTLKAIMLTHDIGKVHPQFQNHLYGKSAGVNHSKPSAWFTYTLTRDFWAAELVCRHHTRLRNTADMVADWLEDNSKNPKEEMRRLMPRWPWLISDKEYLDFEDYLYWQLEDNLCIERWLSVRTMFSLLVAADRIDAIGIGSLPEKHLPDMSTPNLPNRTPEIDAWREKVKEVCLQRARNITRPGVYTLTLPTGAGKTLTGMAIAHEWAKRFGCHSIIYGLPFISIVEQTVGVAKSIFGDADVQEDHSLAYAKENEGSDDTDNAIAWKKISTLFRYWREPIVLTTMVHLWDTLFSPKANKTINFHRLSKAVIIIDEPQTIAPRYWKGLGDTLAYLSEKWNTFFLLMTATQPHIRATAELAPSNTFFPYSRHHYTFLPGKGFNLENLSEYLEKHLPVRENSGLVVMNRKKAALKAYRVLEKMNLNGPLLFLSGWVTPWRRRVILRYLKWLEKKGQRRYLVSTQVIEAGVDLDFDWAFRDIGPLDSVIQIGGRCNRHSRPDFLGEVLVAELSGENGQPLWKNVYNGILIDNARDVLGKHLSFTEETVPFIINEYYQKIIEGLETEPLFSYLANGQWDKLPGLFEEDQPDEVTVFVEENKNVLPILDRIQKTEWTLENRDEQKKLLQKVRQYAIDVPIAMVSACRQYCASIISPDGLPLFRPILGGRAWFLSKAAIKKKDGLYDPRLGFVPPTGEWNNII